MCESLPMAISSSFKIERPIKSETIDLLLYFASNSSEFQFNSFASHHPKIFPAGIQTGQFEISFQFQLQMHLPFFLFFFIIWNTLFDTKERTFWFYCSAESIFIEADYRRDKQMSPFFLFSILLFQIQASHLQIFTQDSYVAHTWQKRKNILFKRKENSWYLLGMKNTQTKTETGSIHVCTFHSFF